MSPFDANLVIAAVGLTVPILFAALGELVAQRAGVINIGLEGMMLNGAFFGFWAAYETHSLLLGVIVGFAAGAVLGVIMAALTISASADQIVVGIGITILAAGTTTFANQQLFTSGGNQATINPISPLAIPGLDQIPVIGKALFDQTPLAYVAYLMVPALWYILYRPNLGLVIRGAGQLRLRWRDHAPRDGAGDRRPAVEHPIAVLADAAVRDHAGRSGRCRRTNASAGRAGAPLPA